MIHRLNIRWRLTLWFGAAMILLLVGRSFWIYHMMERHMMLSTDADLDLRYDVLSQEIGQASDLSELAHALQNYAANNRELDVEVTGPHNEVLLRSNRESPSSKMKSRTNSGSRKVRTFATTPAADGEQRRVISGEFPSPLGNLKVQLSSSLREQMSASQDFVVTLFTTLPLVAVAALAVGYLVSARALTPVDKMISAANDITANRLEQRIDVPDTGDELARLARTLNEMIDRLYKSFEEMKRFTADAAHDLRTPVTILRTEIEVSLMADQTVEEYRNSMQTVLEEAVNLSRLTEQLLDLSREDNGIEPGTLETVHLDSLLMSVVADLQTVAEEKRISIDTRMIRPMVVTGDQVRLRRVLMNLFNNAIQYTHAGGRVWVESEMSPQLTTLVIADNGPGIPAGDLPHIFDRFRRVDLARNRQSGGTGLGLAICKSIIDAHGGHIRAESVLGSGARIVINLPTAHSAA